MKRPTNIFLTCKGCVGMQWEEGGGVFTVWRDRGVQHSPVRSAKHGEHVAYYKSHENAYRPSHRG